LLGGKVSQRPGTGALSDQSLFRGLVAFLRQREGSADTSPFFVATYNIGTHAFLASAPGDANYTGDNAALDKLHNFDAAFGEFLRYFVASPYADNTVLVFTSDHATYPEPPYREVAGPDLKPYFVDRIPLLFLDPRHVLPERFDAQGRNSLDLAPTVLQLAGLQTRANSFLGRSLFEPRNFPTGVAAIASKYYMTTPEGVFAEGEIPAGERDTFRCELDVVRRFYAAERENRIFSPQ
jgi:phosphoglycerol transferase MdoB-like AlkP superfamily enzyme